MVEPPSIAGASHDRLIWFNEIISASKFCGEDATVPDDGGADEAVGVSDATLEAGLTPTSFIA